MEATKKMLQYGQCFHFMATFILIRKLHELKSHQKLKMKHTSEIG